ncbi:MAG: hypothetical protein ACYTAF_04350 [Planctomycetota bacterium]|jgi:hypothetical protein
MNDQLLVGAAEVDITPPVGTALAGNLTPRTSVGVDDPLTVKAIVLESGGVKLVYALFDLVRLARQTGDEAVGLASQRTGIPASHIVWAASHTHSGPYTAGTFGAEEGGIDEEWLAGIPGKLADAVERAHETRRPARMSRERGYCFTVTHNRRLRYKDGREINTWLLHAGEEDVQCLGSAGVTDPEVGILCFDDENGKPIAVVWHYSLHTNSHFGTRFSADYPGVVAARLREDLDPGVVSLFVPGAFADLNPMGGKPNDAEGARCAFVGGELAAVLLDRLKQRTPREEAPALGALKEEMTVPYRDFSADQEERLRRSQWSPEEQEVFRRELEIMRREGVTEAKTLLQAWRIGEVAFASLPGELFLEWGLKIKEESPFPWTFPVELGGGYLGYLVTEQAWKAGGYESLMCRSARPSVEGVAAMVDGSLGLLRKLHGETR